MECSSALSLPDSLHVGRSSLWPSQKVITPLVYSDIDLPIPAAQMLVRTLTDTPSLSLFVRRLKTHLFLDDPLAVLDWAGLLDLEAAVSGIGSLPSLHRLLARTTRIEHLTLDDGGLSHMDSMLPFPAESARLLRHLRTLDVSHAGPKRSAFPRLVTALNNLVEGDGPAQLVRLRWTPSPTPEDSEDLGELPFALATFIARHGRSLQHLSLSFLPLPASLDLLCPSLLSLDVSGVHPSFYMRGHPTVQTLSFPDDPAIAALAMAPLQRALFPRLRTLQLSDGLFAEMSRRRCDAWEEVADEVAVHGVALADAARQDWSTFVRWRSPAWNPVEDSDIEESDRDGQEDFYNQSRLH